MRTTLFFSCVLSLIAQAQDILISQTEDNYNSIFGATSGQKAYIQEVKLDTVYRVDSLICKFDRVGNPTTGYVWAEIYTDTEENLLQNGISDSIPCLNVSGNVTFHFDSPLLNSGADYFLAVHHSLTTNNIDYFNMKMTSHDLYRNGEGYQLIRRDTNGIWYYGNTTQDFYMFLYGAKNKPAAPSADIYANHFFGVLGILTLLITR